MFYFSVYLLKHTLYTVFTLSIRKHTLYTVFTLSIRKHTLYTVFTLSIRKHTLYTVFTLSIRKHTLYTVFTLSIRTVFSLVHLFKISEIFTIFLWHINNQKGLSRANTKYIFYIFPNNQFTIEITQVRPIVWP